MLCHASVIGTKFAFGLTFDGEGELDEKFTVASEHDNSLSFFMTTISYDMDSNDGSIIITLLKSRASTVVLCGKMC